MNVSELIDAVSQFCLGHLPTEKQRKEFLRCLNFSNEDLYSRVRNSRDFLTYEEREVLYDGVNYYILKNGIFKLKTLYVKNIKQTDFPLLTNSTLILPDNSFYNDFTKITLGAKSFDIKNGTNFVKVFYLKPLKKLVEVVNDVNIETNEHIFGSTADHTLVLGTVYYNFLATSGFNKKLAYIDKMYFEKLKTFDEIYNNV